MGVQWATRQGEEGEERERERERELVIEQKMSNRDRPALVGRRFLSVTGRKGSSPPKLKQLYDWDWRAGWIRSSSSEDPAEPELQLLLEYDELAWQEREWFSVYSENSCSSNSPQTEKEEKKKQLEKDK